ncbi:MAG: bacteriocin fulvocin C-related protein [Bacteroidia bacterium]
MKFTGKYLWIAAVAATISLGINCAKEDTLSSGATTQTYSQSRNGIDGHAERIALIGMNAEQQRQVFSTKTAAEKAAIWLDKLNTTLLTGNLSTDQKNVIISLRDQICTDLWVENSASLSSFQTNFHNGWLAVALQHFDEQTLANIVNTPDDYLTPGPWASQGGSDCECNTTSDWCPINMYCKSSNCNQFIFGCGSMWVYRCRGNCDF